MVSINSTNNGVAMAALRRVNSELATTQNRIATGYKVNSAKDNPAVWAAATTMRSDVMATETVKSGINTAKAQVDAAVTVLDEISTLVDEIGKIRNTATASGKDPTDADAAQVKAYTARITSLIASAEIGGKNILVVGAANDLSVATSVAGGALTGAVAYTAAAPTAGAAMTELMAATTDTLLKDLTAADVTSARTELTDLASELGAMSKGFDNALNFLDKMTDIQNSAIGGLVDADLEQESARVAALQVRQQLAYQAISMTNGSQQNVLRLFQ